MSCLSCFNVRPGIASACGGLRGARAHGPRGGLEDDLGGAATPRGGLQPRKGGSRPWAPWGGSKSWETWWESVGNEALINFINFINLELEKKLARFGFGSLQFIVLPWA